MPTKGNHVSIQAAHSRNGTKRVAPSFRHRLVQRIRESSLTTSFAIGTAILVFLVVIFFTEALLHFRAAETASARETTTLAFASELRARSDRELNSVLFLASGIVGYLIVRHDQIDPEEIKQILAAVYGYGKHIRNFSIAVGYRPSYVYPLAGNEQILGRDYRDLTAQWPSVSSAIESRKVVLTGPVNLVQGGTGLIYRAPVFIKDKYWGMLSTVIDMPSFQEAAFRGLNSDRFEFAIRGEEQNGAGGGMLWGRTELFADASALQLEAEMPNGKWIYAVRAKDRENGALTLAIRGLGWMMAILAGLCIHTVLRQRGNLARLAGFDSLTELPNRRLFDDRLQQGIRRNARNGRGQIAVVFLDLNDFKPINDLYGHKFGDLVLRTVATRIREEVRIGDTVSRWAGDEFAIIIEDASEALVARLVDRLHRRIETPFEIEGTTLTISAAIGTAFYPDEAASSVELLELADQRMYKNKERAKNAETNS